MEIWKDKVRATVSRNLFLGIVLTIIAGFAVGWRYYTITHSHNACSPAPLCGLPE